MKKKIIFRLIKLLAMYRVQFDFVDVVLAKATSLKTMANFTTLWNQQFINQGKNKEIKLIIFILAFL